jgi:hypothetical protein
MSRSHGVVEQQRCRVQALGSGTHHIYGTHFRSPRYDFVIGMTGTNMGPWIHSATFASSAPSMGYMETILNLG